jgi:mRNA interferase YafQ
LSQTKGQAAQAGCPFYLVLRAPYGRNPGSGLHVVRAQKRPDASAVRHGNRPVKGLHRVTLDADLFPLVDTLANDQPLEPRHRDHVLSGDWKDHRDCHVKSDLVLIYRKPTDDSLQLVRLGSHFELGL